MEERLLPMDIENSKLSLLRNKCLISHCTPIYRVPHKSLDRPERKHSTATEDFAFHISYL